MSETHVRNVLILEHDVKKGEEERYTEWLTGIPEILRMTPGFIGRDIFLPIPPDRRYTVVLRFDSSSALRNWVKTREHDELRRESKEFLAGHDRSAMAAGFDLWIDPEPDPNQSDSISRPQELRRWLADWLDSTKRGGILRDE